MLSIYETENIYSQNKPHFSAKWKPFINKTIEMFNNRNQGDTL